MYNFSKLLIFITIIACYAFSHSAQTVHVKNVIDGDTIMLNDGNRVRYIGIDCPEMNYKTGNAAPFGNEAKTANKRMLQGKALRLEYDSQKEDRFGRILAYVYTTDGTCINNEIIRQGYAWVLFQPPNIKYANKFLASQRYAMSQKRGLWAHWQEKKGITYIGNSKSKRFHQMDCPYGSRTSRSNRIIFHKKWDAFYAGFSPCKKCILHQTGK